jgi:hypothetical protein
MKVKIREQLHEQLNYKIYQLEKNYNHLKVDGIYFDGGFEDIENERTQKSLKKVLRDNLDISTENKSIGACIFSD